MSPYCRHCLGVARPGEPRCPLDHQFYLRRECSGCEKEIYPRELFCVHCGVSVQEPREVLLLPEEGSRVSMVGALFLDFLGLGLTVSFLFWAIPAFFVLLATLVVHLIYRTWARAQGRQSFGQSVFHLLTVTRDAAPADFSRALRRTVGELFWLPLSFVLGVKAGRELNGFSDCYEVRLV